ncbi:MAG: AAA family ATPase [Xenococcus sp. (in: cyanobacteria)]
MTIFNDNFQYTGKVQPKSEEKDSNGKPLSPYLPNDDLVDAVNLAIYLEGPLLIKGEPGCGKTRLASAVAYELNLPCESWYVKSTSRVKDGLYTYDTVGRLRDAQLAGVNQLKDEEISEIKNPATYINWGPLGKAFQNSKRTVVLIDEIDKADIDFPNDLLLELDEKRFFVDETKSEVSAKCSPIVFITSNNERELPDAFLRRCIFQYIEFPDDKHLKNIILAHFPQSPENIVESIIDHFYELRKKMLRDKAGNGKKVSTSELMDWFKVLQHYPEDEVLTKLSEKLLHPGVLLKSWEDYQKYSSYKKPEVNT